MENTSKSVRKPRDRAYFRQRQRNRVFAELVAFFEEEASSDRISKKGLADLLEKNPSQITRWFSVPSNFELDTISDILLAMGAEMDHRIVRLAERPKANYVHPLIAPYVGRTTEIDIDARGSKKDAIPDFQIKSEGKIEAEFELAQP
jgi:hypothetical protein